MNVPANLKYTKDHEWCKIEGNVATIGITDFAPESVNQNPYEGGWMIKIEMSNPDEVNELLSADDYKAIIG